MVINQIYHFQGDWLVHRVFEWAKRVEIFTYSRPVAVERLQHPSGPRGRAPEKAPRPRRSIQLTRSCTYISPKRHDVVPFFLTIARTRFSIELLRLCFAEARCVHRWDINVVEGNGVKSFNVALFFTFARHAMLKINKE